MDRVRIAQIQNEVKKLNQRMRQIEKSNSTKASNWYKYFERLAHDENAIMTTTKDGKMKIRTDITKYTPQMYNRLYNIIEATEQSKTSTITGIKNTYKKRYEHFKKQTNKNISFSEYVDLWEDQRFRAVVKKYGYSETQELMNHGYANGLSTDDILEELLLADDYTNAYNRLSKEEMQEQYNIDDDDDDWSNIDIDNLW